MVQLVLKVRRLTLKLLEGPCRRKVVYKGSFVGFHVSLAECTLRMHPRSADEAPAWLRELVEVLWKIRARRFQVA